MGLTVVYPPYHAEADDAVALLVKLIKKHAQKHKFFHRAVIYSDDKDFYQLIGEEKYSSVIQIRRNDETLTMKTFKEKFGYHPKRHLDYLALLGDDVDSIPGVPTIGKKTAPKLIEKLSTYEIVKKLLKDGKDWEAFNRNLNLISLEDPIKDAFANVTHYKFDEEEFNLLARKLKMMSFLRESEQESLKNMKPFTPLKGTVMWRK
jgi:5'-3' exonuclease